MNHLDLYYIHRVDPTIPIEETAGVMKELIDQGRSHTGEFQKLQRKSFEERTKSARLQRYRIVIL